MSPQAQLHERIEQVSAASADQDALFSVAVPPGGSLEDAIGEAQERLAAADESAENRAVVDGLEAVEARLRDYETVPDDGVVVYAGVPAGETDVVEHVFDDLPSPVARQAFVRSNEFDTGPLEASQASETWGLLVVERGGAALGRLEDGVVDPVATIDSGVPGKTRAGGQSADRFERRREERKVEFFDTVADEAERTFLEEGDVSGVVLGGTVTTADSFRERTDGALADAVVGGEFAVDYAGEQGLRQLADRAKEAREEFARRDAERALEAFFEALAADEDEPVAYGPDAVETALSYEAVETLLLAASLEAADLQGYREAAEETGAAAVVVPEGLERTEQFETAFDGVGALLRFPLE